MIKVSVVIVNHNTKDVLRDCLANLSQISDSYGLMEIIVVDNASSDGSVEMVKEKFHHVQLILSENKGLAAGYNKGIDRSSGEYILYLGSDTFPNEVTIKGMADYLDQNKDIGAATCELVLRNGLLDMDAHRGFPTPWASLTHFSRLNRLFPKSKIFNKYFLGWKDFSKPHEIDLCISHFMMIRKSVFEKVGRWDEDYFVYGEDVDMCYRIKQAGYKIMYLPQWEAIHYKGVGVGIRSETSDITKASIQTRSKMSRETTRAMRLFYKKHYAEKYPEFVTDIVLFAIGQIEKARTKKVAGKNN